VARAYAAGPDGPRLRRLRLRPAPTTSPGPPAAGLPGPAYLDRRLAPLPRTPDEEVAMDTLTASAPAAATGALPSWPAAPADGRAHRRDLGGATPWLFYGGLVVAAVLSHATAAAWMSPATSSASSAAGCPRRGRRLGGRSLPRACTPTGPSSKGGQHASCSWRCYRRSGHVPGRPVRAAPRSGRRARRRLRRGRRGHAVGAGR
jgi:hypothetical protein